MTYFIRSKFLLSLCLILNITAVSSSQTLSDFLPDQSPLPTPLPVTREDVQTKIVDYQSQLESIQSLLDTANGSMNQKFKSEYTKQVNLLQRLLTIYERQINSLNQIDDYKEINNQLEEDLVRIRAQGPPEEPPYSFLTLDSQLSQLYTSMEKESTIRQSLENTRESVQQAIQLYREQDSQWRLARERLDNISNENEKAFTEIQVTTELLERQIAKETLNLRRIEVDIQQLKLNENLLRQQINQTLIDFYRREAIFPRETLDEILTRINNEIEAVIKEEETAELNRNFASVKLSRIRGTIEEQENSSELLLAQENTQELEYESYVTLKNTLMDQRDRLNDQIDIWQHRYDIFNDNATIEELEDWLHYAESSLINYENRIQQIISQLISWGRETLILEERIEATEDPQIRQELERAASFRAARTKYARDNYLNTEVTRQLYQKLVDEIESEFDIWTFNDVYEYVKLRINDFMNFPLWTGEDEEPILTVGKLIYALLLLVLGFLFARFFCRFVLFKFLMRVGMPEGASASLQSLTYYLIIAAVIIFAMRMVSIPVTAFAFLGGALAIAIGFGSQNILNNFISGLILLIEQPIRVGDMIDVDGLMGTVQRIGARSTQILSFDNIDLMIPNSKLLENKVINITLSDNVVRTKIHVGIKYGSNTRDVFKMLYKAVEDHGLVLKNPAPYVILSNFGEYRIEFTVYFFCVMTRYSNRLILESDIRHRIYSLFEDAGIEIPIPQSDIHFQTDKPVPVQFVRKTEDDDNETITPNLPG